MQNESLAIFFSKRLQKSFAKLIDTFNKKFSKCYSCQEIIKGSKIAFYGSKEEEELQFTSS